MRTVRRALLRRVVEGRVCGAPTITGAPCLQAPVAPGRPCTTHTRTVAPPGASDTVLSGSTASPLTLAWHTFGKYLPPEQQSMLAALCTADRHSLDDMIDLVRLRIVLHVRRYTQGTYTFSEFEDQCSRCSAELAKLMDTNLRLKLGAIELAKSDLSAHEPDMFDATAPPEDYEPTDAL